MARRTKTPADAVAHVLVKSRRRCCLCVALRNDFTEKRGQIAHLDRDPSNNDLDNLAFLCLEHHDQYDSRPSQSKGLTMDEVKRYRAALTEETPRAERAPDVRVRVDPAIAGVSSDEIEYVLVMAVENHSSTSIFLRNIQLLLSDEQMLFFPRDYFTGHLNASREIRPGEAWKFHVGLEALFSDGRKPENFRGVFAVDEIDRAFRFDGKHFDGTIRGLYEQFVGNNS